MEIAAAHADLREIFGQVLGHALRQRGYQDALVFLRTYANFFEQIVYLTFHGTNLYLGIDESGGADDLFDHDSTRLRKFIRARRRRNINHLIHAVLELLKGERPVVKRRGHAESIVNESLFARSVAIEHAAHLAHGLVRFIDEHQEILRDVVE